MRRVIAGDDFSIQADEMNAMLKIAEQNNVSGNHRGGSIPAHTGYGEVYVKNTSEQNLEIFAAVELLDPEITPENNLEDFLDCVPIFQASIATESAEKIAILCEPVNAGEIGRAKVMGITPAKITVKSESHQYAAPIPNDPEGKIESVESSPWKILYASPNPEIPWAMLQLGGGGGGGGTIYKDQIYLCQLTGLYDETLGYQVTVFLDNNTESTNRITSYIRFTIADGMIPANIAGRFVLAKIYPTIVYGGQS